MEREEGWLRNEGGGWKRGLEKNMKVGVKGGGCD